MHGDRAPQLKAVVMLLCIVWPVMFMALLQKSLIGMLLVAAAASFIYILCLDSYYHLYGAREPQPTDGRIYPMTVHHGTHVFVTEKEKLNFDALLPSISIGSVLIAGLLNLRWKCFPTPVYINPKWGVDAVAKLKRKKKK